MRVPLMQGFPKQTFGSADIPLSSGFMGKLLGTLTHCAKLPNRGGNINAVPLSRRGHASSPGTNNAPGRRVHPQHTRGTQSRSRSAATCGVLVAQAPSFPHRHLVSSAKAAGSAETARIVVTLAPRGEKDARMFMSGWCWSGAFSGREAVRELFPFTAPLQWATHGSLSARPPTQLCCLT
jgi:hypothetical protein